MRVLIIGPFPPPIYGVSLSNTVLKNGLVQRGYKVNTINTAGGKKIDSEVGAWNIRKLSFIACYFGMYKIFSSDVVYTTPGQTFFGILKYAPFIILAKIFGKKLIIHVKGGYLKQSYDNMNSLKKWIVRNILSLYDGGIVLSKSLRVLLKDFLPENKIYVRHNFIQDALLLSAEDILKQKKYDKIRIIYLSNLMQEKGIGELLSALEILHEKQIPFSAKIAGHIPKNDKSLLSKMQEISDLEYMGVVEKKRKTELLCWGNLFCLPTYYSMEGQPISILEALGFGNVILTTKHAGIPDICSSKNGVFVDKRSAESIVGQLIYLSENLSWMESTGIYNLNEAQVLYSEKSFVEGVLSIMEEV